MPYFSQAMLNDIQDKPETISGYYAQHGASFKSALGLEFAAQCDDHIRLAFCSIVAFDLKPYGTSLARGLKALLADSVLDCDNYVSLAWELFYLMRPLSTTKVAAVGWNGGAVGNHAQIQASTPGSPDIFLDPTIGLVVHGCGMDALCFRFQFGSQFQKSFWSFNSARHTPALNAFEQSVRAAITSGLYKTSDLLYFVPGLPEWNALLPQDIRGTPQGWAVNPS